MHKLHFWLFAGLCVLSAQASAGLFSDDEARTQIQQLEARLVQLEKTNIRLEEANKQQTGSMLDMLTQIESLSQELRKLQGQNEELAHNLQDAKNRQKDFYVDLDARLRHFESSEASAQTTLAQKATEKSVGSRHAGPHHSWCPGRHARVHQEPPRRAVGTLAGCLKRTHPCPICSSRLLPRRALVRSLL